MMMPVSGKYTHTAVNRIHGELAFLTRSEPTKFQKSNVRWDRRQARLFDRARQPPCSFLFRCSRGVACARPVALAPGTQGRSITRTTQYGIGSEDIVPK